MRRRPELPGYDAEAEFYDLCWSPFRSDIEFFRRRMGRPGRVLDLMCGTGRVTLALARWGWRVDGVDRSEGMLRVARAKLNAAAPAVRGRVGLHRGDICRLRLPHVFSAAVMPANSFPLILKRRERVRALRNVHRHLGRTGVLLVHIDTPLSYRSAREGVSNVNVFRLEHGHRWYVRSLSERFVGRDVVRGVTTHVIVDRQGRLQRHVTTETQTRVLSTVEVVRELKEAGFASTRVFGDYSGGRPVRGSSFVVIEAAA